MKININSVLIGAAFLLGACVFYYSAHKGSTSTPAALGGKVLPNLAPNRVGKLVITSKEGATTVAKSKDKWVVASRFNYPANFDKVADSIRELSELKIGQTVNVTPSQLESLNLITPIPSGTNRITGAGTLLELRDEKDGLLASLLIGKSFMRQPNAPSTEMMMGFGGYPDGQYIQTVDGKVYLVSKSLDRLMESSKTWLEDNFIDAAAADLKEISISGPERASIKLFRSKEGDAFEIADLRAEEGALDSAKVSQIAGVLSRLGFDDVADPALSLKDTGLDRPIVLKAVTKEGLIYSLQLGNTLTNDTFDRYLTVSVTNEPLADQAVSDKQKQEQPRKEDQPAPAQKNISEQVAALNSKFGPWIYVIKSYRAEPILLSRAELIKKPEPPKTEGAQTNAPGQKAEGSVNNVPPDAVSVPVQKGLKVKAKK